MVKELPINTRIIQELAKGTIKNLVDGTVELVTNCDDSYRRIEGELKGNSGEIEIYVNRKKGGICEIFRIKDFAEGMTKEELENAMVFAGETSGFASGKSVRGFFGRGLKETIIALGEGSIKSVKNGKVFRTKLWIDKKSKKPQYDDEALNENISTDEPNGTEVEITITNEKIKIPEFDKFKEQVSRHYALRQINSSQKRKVNLIFEDLKRKIKITETISFQLPTGKKVVDKELRMKGYDDLIKITIYESSEALESPRNNPYGRAGILIKTKGGTLDNQLFKFENEPAGLYFYGEALCEGLEERLREGETEIIDQNRGGLEWRYEYCQALSQTIEEVLEPLILDKRKTLDRNPEKEVTESTKKMLRNLCNLLNAIAKQELEDFPEFPVGEPDPDITRLLIKPEVANIPKDSPRFFSIYAPEGIVNEEGDEAIIKSDSVDILPLSTKLKLKKPEFPKTIWYRYFKVVGYKEGAEGNIIVTLGKETAQAKVKVAPLKKRKKGEPTGRKGGFISDIVPDDLNDPPQRVDYRDGIIRIYTQFPSVKEFIKSGLEGVETPEGRLLLAELVGEAFCRELARQGLDYGKYQTFPGGEIDSFIAAFFEEQKKCLHKIQKIILAWKFQKNEH